MRGFVGVTMGLVILGCLGMAGEALAADLAAPYTVIRARGVYVRVDIGSRRDNSRPLRTATVLTPQGALPATLVRVERVCVKLCGDDGEDECHYEAVVRATRTAATALAVLPGLPAVTDVAAVAPGPDVPIGDESRWLAAAPLSDPSLGTLRWTRYPDGVFLTAGTGGRDVYAPAIALSSCHQRSAARFTRLICGGSAELLYDGERAVSVSFAEYGASAAEPVLRLSVEGREVFVMRYGIKAETVMALLIGQGADWKVLFREAEHALLC